MSNYKLSALRRPLIVAAIALAGCLAASGTAAAGSIVYIDNGNIVALHDGQFVHVDRHGHLLGEGWLNGFVNLSKNYRTGQPRSTRAARLGPRSTSTR